MNQHKPILTDAEMHALISGNPFTLGLSIARLKDFIRQVEKAVAAKLAEQEPATKIDYFGDTCCPVSGDRLQLKRGTKLYAHPVPALEPDYYFYKGKLHCNDGGTHLNHGAKEYGRPLYDRSIPNSQGFLDNSNHIPDASKMLTPLARRKIQSKLAEGYRKIESATVLVNENGRAAIVNHGGAFYWVENSALAREYDGRPIPVNSCRPTETNKKGANA